MKDEAERPEALEWIEKLRERVLARNRDLTPEEGDALADRFAREFVEDLGREGRIRFERQCPSTDTE